MRRDDESEAIRRLLAAADLPRAGEPPVDESPRERLWRQLELPPPAPVPPGFAARVAARAAVERRQAFELPLPPCWARVAAALAVVAGVAGGAGLGLLAAAESEAADAGAEPPWSEASFAEELYAGLDEVLTSDLPAPGSEVAP